MARIYSTGIGLLLVVLLMGGCSSVPSTSAFYIATTTDLYLPKPKNYPIPILNKSPNRPYKTIGTLVFQSRNGWPFMRESMLYNARQNGADAVILRSTSERKKRYIAEVPPQMNWVPTGGGYYGGNCGGYYRAGPTFVPIYSPGYIQEWTDVITAINAEMIVLKK